LCIHDKYAAPNASGSLLSCMSHYPEILQRKQSQKKLRIEPEPAVHRPKKRKQENVADVKLESVYDSEFNFLSELTPSLQLLARCVGCEFLYSRNREGGAP
jgi:hypothetical protein